MPATRKSSRAAAAKGTGRQSTLSFNNRVSKAGAAKVSAKEAAILTPPASSSLVKKEGAAVVNPSDEVEVEVGKLEVPDDAEEVVEPEDVTQQEVQKSPVEARAERVTDAQIKKYWREVEAVRIARRVHQEELSLAEKVLRYFDISSQYGPCIGIPRVKRWHRAEKLGLNPPIEVLAVLLKEEKQGHGDIESSAMDRHLASTAIGSL